MGRHVRGDLLCSTHICWGMDMTDREHLVHIARMNIRFFETDQDLAEWVADLMYKIINDCTIVEQTDDDH